jgi:fructoselysine-6-phosphate deglycase
MLSFNRDRYLAIQNGAVGLAAEIDVVIGKLIAADVKNIFFVGTGGVAFLMHPAANLLQRKSEFPTILAYSAELAITGAATLTDKSIVVMPSLSGTTKESVDLLAKLKAVGATTITLVGHKETPLGRDGDYSFVNFAEDDTSCESFYIQSLLIALSVLKARGEISNYNSIIAELVNLPKFLLAAKESFEPQASAFADKIASANYHMFTGAGNSWPEAHYYAMCILEEMQWIRTRPVHASDFFHGALELLENDVSLFVFQGEDDYRPLTERVIAFAPQVTNKVTVLDTRDVKLGSMSAEVRGLVSPIVIACLLERASAHLEIKRNHPLTTRRYYKRHPY